jgi:prepilin-type N-terminal cleavage/methylation domain-containing protein
MKKTNKGFTLIEMVVTMALLTASTAITVPIITRNRGQGDVNRYVHSLESGLLNLKAKLGQTKTNCAINFPTTFTFQKPESLVEFSQGKNEQTSMKCCNSEISKLTNDTDCLTGYAGNRLGELTGKAQDNLRLVQQESTPASKEVRVAVSKTNFGLTPPGTTANLDTITFLICHEQAASTEDPTSCIPSQNKLNIGCVEINGAGEIKKGTWALANAESSVSSGSCRKT